MHWAWYVFFTVSWTLALVWLGQALAILRGMPRLRDLTRMDDGSLPVLPDAQGPHLTVIIAARNEEQGIKATLISLLASTGLRIEIIAVDDRSEDGTGAIMDEVATTTSGPHCVKVIRVRQLPPNWLGKPYALALGARDASAPWLLFTDGDVLFAPDALALSLRAAMALHADHLVIAPTLILKTISERAMSGAMQAVAQWAVGMWKVSDPSARDFIGVGAFNLIRREVYDSIGGFESLRMEVLEDLYLGKRVKRGGFAQEFVLGPGLIQIRWLNGMFSVLRLLEKNGFAMCRFRVGLEMLTCFGLLIDVFWPLAAIGAGGWVLPAGILTYAAFAAIYHANRRMSGVSASHALLFAPAIALLIVAFLRSMTLTIVRGGVVWRSTRYPLNQLRRYARMQR